jgi:putative transposase
MKGIKCRSSRLLQQEYPKLKERYWGKHFWASDYGAWSTGNITDKMVNEYLELHRQDSSDKSNFVLEK